MSSHPKKAAGESRFPTNIPEGVTGVFSERSSGFVTEYDGGLVSSQPGKPLETRADWL